MPERIQLRRSKGWRTPCGAVDVSQPSKWENPWWISECHQTHTPGQHWHVYHRQEPLGGIAYPTQRAARLRAVTCFRNWMLLYSDHIAECRVELGGHDLACWCTPGQWCHADVLLELANKVAES